jgi:predicted porin
MKKTLIAAAAMFAAAGAMAQVTIVGTIDTTLRMSEFNDVATTKVGRDGSGTTGFIIKINEDLGGGLKAIGLYEHDFDPHSGTGSDNGGEKYAGLQGAFGSIKLGVPNAPSLTIQSGLRGAPFGTKDGGRAGAGGTVAPKGGATDLQMFGKNLTRHNGSIVYETPNMSGFSAVVDYVPASEDQTGAAATGAITDIGAFYKSGPIWGGVAMYSEAENEDGTSLEKSLLHLGLHYNLGFATVGLGYHTYSIDGEVENTGLNVLGIVPLSEQLSLGLNYQMLTAEEDTLLRGDVTQIAVGVNYQLSKMTSVYARYVSTDGDDYNAGDAATTMLAGLRVNF